MDFYSADKLCQCDKKRSGLWEATPALLGPFSPSTFLFYEAANLLITRQIGAAAASLLRRRSTQQPSLKVLRDG